MSRISQSAAGCAHLRTINKYIQPLTLMTITSRCTVWIINDLEIIVKGEENNLAIPRIRRPIPLNGRLSVKMPHEGNIVHREITRKIKQLVKDWLYIFQREAISGHYQHLLTRDSNSKQPQHLGSARLGSTSFADSPRKLFCSDHLRTWPDTHHRGYR